MINSPSVHSPPVWYAILVECVEAVRILLENGSVVCANPVSAALCTKNPKIVDLVVNALRDRRRRLYDLALDILPGEALTKLKVDPSCILDERLHYVERSLQSLQVHIPTDLQGAGYRTTIYHSSFITLESAQIAYNAGFRDVNGRDVKGRTPLMIQRHMPIVPEIAYIKWLISKGADLRTTRRTIRGLDPISLPGQVRLIAAHHIAQNLAWALKVLHARRYELSAERAWSLFHSCFSRLPASSSPIAFAILSHEQGDSCRCCCSSLGCTSLKIFLGSYYWCWSRRTEQVWWHMPTITWLESQENTDQRVPVFVWVDIMRLETFKVLGLTHTCCQDSLNGDSFQRQRLDAEEIAEIHEEQIWLTKRVDALVHEFKTEFEQSNMRCSSFLRGYWRTRMNEVLQERPLDATEQCAEFESIGVVLKDTDDFDAGRQWLDRLFE